METLNKLVEASPMRLSVFQHQESFKGLKIRDFKLDDLFQALCIEKPTKTQ